MRKKGEEEKRKGIKGGGVRREGEEELRSEKGREEGETRKLLQEYHLDKF